LLFIEFIDAHCRIEELKLFSLISRHEQAEITNRQT
jgi:hypothetical protein